MKTPKFFRFLLVLVLPVMITGFAGGPGNKKEVILKYQGEIVIPGLSSEVTVYRDEKGMPHIYADNEHDLYFAVGFVMAQERLWQMDLIRRTTTGRLSEIFGKSFVQTDLFLRCLDMTTKSKMVLNNENPAVTECLQSFTDGVNAYISGTGKHLPPEFRILSYKPEPWKLEDITNIIGYMGWTLSLKNLTSELFNYQLVSKLGLEKASGLIPDWKSDSNLVFPDFEIDDSLINRTWAFVSSLDKLVAIGVTSFSGSNNWAVSGKKTETGKPVLSNDMHLSFGSPGIWMQMHQVIPGKLNVTGVMVPGQPFIIAGHNEKIAWGMTNLSVDDIDLFAEKINPGNQNQYFFNGEWKNMISKDEIIRIKKGKADTLDLKFTHRGPIISGLKEIKDISLSMRWSGYDNSDEVRGVYLLDRAEGWDDFRRGLSTFRTVSQNFVYADTEGNIGLNTGGGIAIRKRNGNLTRNGESDEYDWKGYVPFEQLPYSYNPEKNFVSSANNKTVSEEYPYYISMDFAMPYRINRIRQMIEGKDVINIDDFKLMINDQHSDYAALLTPFILKLNDRKGELAPAEITALAYFSEWDYDMNVNLVAPTIFEFFRRSFMKNLLADELGDLYGQLFYLTGEYYIYRILKTGSDAWVDNINTPRPETLDDIIMMSFKDCISSLSKQYGNNQTKWKWGNIHKLTIKHPLGSVKLLNFIYGLNSDKYSVGGSDHTVSPYASYEPGSDIIIGASERHIFNTADWDESFTVLPTGASGIPSSEFYLSQTKTYVEGKFYKDHFSENAVKAAAKYILKLKPQK